MDIFGSNQRKPTTDLRPMWGALVGALWSRTLLSQMLLAFIAPRPANGESKISRMSKSLRVSRSILDVAPHGAR
jgi:hypothetical protein